MDDDFGESSTPASNLLTCAFNQDGGCLAIGTTNGFSVHNIHPQYALSVDRQLRGGIGRVEMLFRCNLMALVGGGPTPHSAPHRVLIWDDHLPKEIGELSFRQAVLQVKLRKDAIAVALRDRIYVYHLADLSLRDKIYTADNPHGLLALSTQVQDMVLACPSVTTGHVRVELYGMRKTVLLEAHDGQLRGLCLTASGSLLATASVKGTVIRVWNIASQLCIHEFRRGVERANITCLAFSWDDQWLSCCSDKGTAHVFFCEQNQEEKKPSSLAKMIFSPSSKPQPKSVCQIRGVPHPLACAFVGDAPNILAVAGWDADGNGVLLISEFAAHQEARRIAYHVLVRNGIEETEEEKRRRRARGWKPSVPETPDECFSNLQISEPAMNHLSTNDVEDEDFCEVLVGNLPLPVIESKPPEEVSSRKVDDESSVGKEKSTEESGEEVDGSTDPLDKSQTSQ
mmetsp:Transcript_36311/g.104526  ORF Transcript_36311/g.104526 Transcript_36311/m.104526 type:complete len:455 (+) Transcript_36311:236-1600(+)